MIFKNLSDSSGSRYEEFDMATITVSLEPSMEVEKCTLCNSEIRLVQINFTEAIRICPNTKCIHPFVSPNAPLELLKRDFMNICLNSDKVKDNEKVIFNSVSQHLQKDDFDFLDDFFTNCGSAEITEDEIQTVDSLFESLQNSAMK